MLFLGFFCSHGVPCCNSDHLDLVVYLMMRTQSARVYPSTSRLVVRTDPPPICLFNFHHLSFRLCSPPTPLLCSAAFLIEGFMLSPFSLVCFCQRDTCCRIAEFSCLLNLLTTLNYFIPALSHHIFTQPHCISIHSHHSPSFPSSWVSVSLPTQRVHALDFKDDKSHLPFNCFSISRHFHTFYQSMTTLSPPSPRFPPLFKVTPFYRRGTRVICWIGLPLFIPPSHMIPPHSSVLTSFIVSLFLLPVLV